MIELYVWGGGGVKKEVFQEDSFSCYAPSLSWVSKIPRWASLVT